MSSGTKEANVFSFADESGPGFSPIVWIVLLPSTPRDASRYATFSRCGLSSGSCADNGHVDRRTCIYPSWPAAFSKKAHKLSTAFHGNSSASSALVLLSAQAMRLSKDNDNLPLVSHCTGTITLFNSFNPDRNIFFLKLVSLRQRIQNVHECLVDHVSFHSVTPNRIDVVLLEHPWGR